MAPGVLKTNQWMHLAATVDAEGKGTLYVNGVAVAKASLFLPSKLLRPRQYNYIGKSNWSTDGHFQGKLAELRIWNTARSAADIKANMNRRLQSNEAGLVLHLPLDNSGEISDPARPSLRGQLHGTTWSLPAGLPLERNQASRASGMPATGCRTFRVRGLARMVSPDRFVQVGRRTVPAMGESRAGRSGVYSVFPGG